MKPRIRVSPALAEFGIYCHHLFWLILTCLAAFKLIRFGENGVQWRQNRKLCLLKPFKWKQATVQCNYMQGDENTHPQIRIQTQIANGIHNHLLWGADNLIKIDFPINIFQGNAQLQLTWLYVCSVSKLAGVLVI